MTYAWARWLLPALLTDPVVAPKVIVVPGWETRGRPPAEFSFFPSGLLDHHTACFCRVGHDPQSCINGIVAGNAITPGPISQLLGTFTRPGVKFTGGNVDPHIVVIAAGRANHAGSGRYNWGAPSGNGSSIGIEWCGPVDRWPDRVVEFRERVDAALLRDRNWGVHQIDTHHSYATPSGRKIDPSGATSFQPTLGITAPWSASLWRTRVAARMSPPPPPLPPPPPQGDDMRPIITTWQGEPWPILVGFDPVASQYTWRGIPGDQVDALLARGAAADGRAQPWPATWKTAPWVKRLG
jgi:hypothetical protein